MEEKEVRIIKKPIYHLSLRLPTRDTLNIIGPSQLGLRDQSFLKKMYITVHTKCPYLKNARNGNSILKIQKWPSLRLLALLSKFIWQFEFSEDLEDIYGKCCWRVLLSRNVLLSSNFFHTKLSYFKIQTVIRSHSLLQGDSKLTIFIFSTCFFYFWHS